jgi:hypothetical protein
MMIYSRESLITNAEEGVKVTCRVPRAVKRISTYLNRVKGEVNAALVRRRNTGSLSGHHRGHPWCPMQCAEHDDLRVSIQMLFHCRSPPRPKAPHSPNDKTAGESPESENGEKPPVPNRCDQWCPDNPPHA